MLCLREEDSKECKKIYNDCYHSSSYQYYLRTIGNDT